MRIGPTCRDDRLTCDPLRSLFPSAASFGSVGASGCSLLRARRPGHDHLELANGNVMLMSYVDRACVDLTELGLGDCETAIAGYLQEIDPATGALVWQWRSQDHIPVSAPHSGRAPKFCRSRALARGRRIPRRRSVGVGSAGVYRIDRSTGAVEWKLGGGPGLTRLTMTDDPFDGTIVRVFPVGTRSFERRPPGRSATTPSIDRAVSTRSSFRRPAISRSGGIRSRTCSPANRCCSVLRV